MASIIQIKRGTGSAVPSGLADGELALNLDNGKLFYGSSSVSVNSFTFKNLTAENYIVSTSVTNITTQTLSGSTQFGDSVDDTHQFTGAITASGDISASGDLIANRLQIENVVAVLGNTTDGMKFGFHNTVPIQIGKSTNPTTIVGPVTASIISASGTITGNSIVGTLGTAAQTNITSVGTLGSLTVSGDITANGNIVGDDATNITNIATIECDSVTHDGDTDTKITFGNDAIRFTAGNVIGVDFNSVSSKFHLPVTASGNISSSAYVYADRVFLQNNDVLRYSALNSGLYVNGGIQTIGNSTFGNGDTDIHKFNGAVTASGNISSSGTVTGNSIVGTLGTAAQTNITSVGTLSAITVAGNINANGNIVGDDGTNITNIAAVKCDTLAADANDTTQLSLQNIQINALVNDTDVFNVTETLFTHDIPVKFSSHITASSNISSSGEITSATSRIGLRNLGGREDTLHHGAAGSTAQGDIFHGPSGTSTDAGKIYTFAANGNVLLADKDIGATATGSLLLAVGSNAGQGMLLRGMVKMHTDVTANPGDPLYLGDNGLVTTTIPSSGDFARIIGHYQSGSGLIYFNPDNTFVEIS